MGRGGGTGRPGRHGHAGDRSGRRLRRVPWQSRDRQQRAGTVGRRRTAKPDQRQLSWLLGLRRRRNAAGRPRGGSGSRRPGRRGCSTSYTARTSTPQAAWGSSSCWPARLAQTVNPSAVPCFSGRGTLGRWLRWPGPQDDEAPSGESPVPRRSRTCGRATLSPAPRAGRGVKHKSAAGTRRPPSFGFARNSAIRKCASARNLRM